MKKYKYVAINKKGKEFKGIEQADTLQEAVAAVRGKELFLVKIEPFGGKSFFSSFFTLSTGRVKQKTLTISTRQLATLLNAGLPLVRALKVIKEQQTKGAWENALGGIVESIEGGGSFSDALSGYHNIFSKMYVSMARAGEASGMLEIVLGRLAEYLEKSQRLKSKIISALIYPCLVLGLAFSILLGLMIFVIPKFAEMFDDMGVELPVVTGFLIRTSKNMLTVKFWIILVAVIAGIFILFRFLKSIRKGQYFIDKVKLKLPVVGNLTQKTVTSRFARTLGTLVSSGVPILQALINVKEVVGNDVIAEGIELVHDSVKEGESIVEPLRQSRVFDPIIVNMVAVGEETGKLDEMLIRVADAYDNEIDVLVGSITSLLEPILIITLAFVIGFIVIALFLPLVSLLTGLAM